MQSFVSLLLALVALANAQTPNGFQPAATQDLAVTFSDGSKVVSGQPLDRSVVAKQPTIRLANGSMPTGQFMQFIVDIDVPAKDGSKSTFLHLAQSNLAASSNSSTSASNTTSAATLATAPYANTTTNSNAANSSSVGAAALNASNIEASYIQPSPPPGSGPHRYVVMMFAQPSNFSVPAKFASLAQADSNPSARSGFDINSFISSSGLGAPIAGTFFTVENTTSAAASNSTGSTSSSSSSTGEGASTGSTSSSTGSTSSTGSASSAPAGNATAAAATTNGTSAADNSTQAATTFKGQAGAVYESPSLFGLVVLVGAIALGLY